MKPKWYLAWSKDEIDLADPLEGLRMLHWLTGIR